MKELHADSILMAMEQEDMEDEEAKIENRFQTDLEKFLRAKTTQLGLDSTSGPRQVVEGCSEDKIIHLKEHQAHPDSTESISKHEPITIKKLC